MNTYYKAFRGLGSGRRGGRGRTDLHYMLSERFCKTVHEVIRIQMQLEMQHGAGSKKEYSAVRLQNQVIAL